MKKIFSVLFTSFFLLFSLNSNATDENSLNDLQKAKLYEILAKYNKENKDISEEKEFDAFSESTKTINLVMEGVKSMYSKIKKPVGDFFNTDLAKASAVIIFIHFLGEYILEYVFLFSMIILSIQSLIFFDNMLLINNNKIVEHKSNSRKHGEFIYETVEHPNDSAWPLFYRILMGVLIVASIAIIF